MILHAEQQEVLTDSKCLSQISVKQINNTVKKIKICVSKIKVGNSVVNTRLDTKFCNANFRLRDELNFSSQCKYVQEDDKTALCPNEALHYVTVTCVRATGIVFERMPIQFVLLCRQSVQIYSVTAVCTVPLLYVRNMQHACHISHLLQHRHNHTPQFPKRQSSC